MCDLVTRLELLKASPKTDSFDEEFLKEAIEILKDMDYFGNWKETTLEENLKLKKELAESETNFQAAQLDLEEAEKSLKIIKSRMDEKNEQRLTGFTAKEWSWFDSRKAGTVMNQIKQIQLEDSATCPKPCGKKLSIKSSNFYRCLYCNVVFCKECAEIHFGQTVKDYRKKRIVKEVQNG